MIGEQKDWSEINPLSVDPRYGSSPGMAGLAETVQGQTFGLSEPKPEGFFTEMQQSIRRSFGEAGAGIAKTALVLAGDAEAAKYVDEEGERAMADRPWLRPIDYGSAWDNLSKGGMSWIGQQVGSGIGSSLPYAAAGLGVGGLLRGTAMGAARAATAEVGIGYAGRAAAAATAAADSASLIRIGAAAQKVGQTIGAQVASFSTTLGDNYLRISEESEKNGVNISETGKMFMAAGMSGVSGLIEQLAGSTDMDLLGGAAMKAMARRAAKDATMKESIEAAAKAAFFSKFYGSGSYVARVLKQGAGEAVEEGLQFASDEAFLSAGAGKEIDYGAAASDIIEAMAGGFFGGVGMGGITEAMRVRSETKAEAIFEEPTAEEVKKLGLNDAEVKKTEEFFTAFADTLPEKWRPVAPVIRNASFKMAAMVGGRPESYVDRLKTVIIDDAAIPDSKMQSWIDGLNTAMGTSSKALLSYFDSTLPKWRNEIKSIKEQVNLNGLKRVNDNLEREVMTLGPRMIDQATPQGKAKVDELVSTFQSSIASSYGAIIENEAFSLPRRDVLSAMREKGKEGLLRDLYVNGPVRGVKLTVGEGSDKVTNTYDIEMTSTGVVFRPSSEGKAAAKAEEDAAKAPMIEREAAGEMVARSTEMDIAREKIRTKRLESLRSRIEGVGDVFTAFGLPTSEEISSRIEEVADRLTDPAYSPVDRDESDFYAKHKDVIDNRKESLIKERREAEAARLEKEASERGLAEHRALVEKYKKLEEGHSFRRLLYKTGLLGKAEAGKMRDVSITDEERLFIGEENAAYIDSLIQDENLERNMNAAAIVEMLRKKDEAETLQQNRQKVFATINALRGLPPSPTEIEGAMPQAAKEPGAKAAAERPRVPFRGAYTADENKLAMFYSSADAGTVLHEWVHHVVYENLMPDSIYGAFKKQYGRDDEDKSFEQIKRENPSLSDTQIMSRIKWTSVAEENLANSFIVYVRDGKLQEGAPSDLVEAFGKLKSQFKSMYKNLNETRFVDFKKTVVIKSASAPQPEPTDQQEGEAAAQQDEGFPVMGRDRGAAGRREAQFDERMRMRDAKENDARYLELANDPESNKEELQRMVDEAARAAGYRSGIVYHSTTKQFNAFDLEAAKNTSSPSAYGLFWFASSPEVSKLFTQNIDESTWPPRIVQRENARTMNVVLSGRFVEVSASDFIDKYRNDKDALNKIMNGYDGIIVKADSSLAEAMGGGEYSADTIAVKNPNQIKSADPITRDDAGNIIPLSRRFESASPDIRFQQADVASEQDARYMELAKDPEANKEELQRIVDEAAKRAGYAIGPVWHGGRGRQDFTVFDIDRMDLGAHFGAEAAAKHMGGIRRAFHLDIKNPLRMPDMGTWTGDTMAAYLREHGFPQARESMSKQEVRDMIVGAGYDGIVYLNRGETGVAYDEYRRRTRNFDTEFTSSTDEQFRKVFPEASMDSYVVFSPTQIKLVDPIARDDQGNIIPPSQRFKTTSPDIRFQQTEDARVGKYEYIKDKPLKLSEVTRRELDAIFQNVTEDEMSSMFGQEAAATVDDSRHAMGSDPATAQRNLDDAVGVAMQRDPGLGRIFGAAKKVSKITKMDKKVIVDSVISEYGYSSVTEIPDDMKVAIAKRIRSKYGSSSRAATAKAVDDPAMVKIRDAIVDVMRSAPRTWKPSAVTAGSMANAVRLKNGIKWMARKYAGEFADRFEILDLLEDNPDGPLHTYVGEWLQAGDDKKYSTLNRYEKRLLELEKEYGGFKRNLDQTVDLGGVMHKLADALSLYTHANAGKGDWKNLYPVQQIMVSNGITEKEFEAAINLVSSDKQLKSIVDASQKFFKEIIEELDPVAQEVTGERIGRVSGLYLTMVRSSGLIHDGDFMAALDTMTGDGKFRRPSDVANYRTSPMKSRASGTERMGMVELDFRKAMYRYYTQAANYIGAAPAIKKSMSVLNTKEVSDAMAERFGNQNDVFNDLMYLMRRDLSPTGRVDPYDNYEKIFGWLSQNAYASFMSANPWTVMNQLLSLPASMAYLSAFDAAAVVNRFGKMVSKMFATAGRLDYNDPTIKLIAEKAPHILRRFPNQALEEWQATHSTGIGKTGLSMGGMSVSKMIQIGFVPMVTVDMAVTMAIWETAYNSKMKEYRLKGSSPSVSEKAATLWANKVVRRTQNPSIYAERGKMQSKNEFIKSLSPFSGQGYAAFKANMSMIYPIIKGYQAGGWAGAARALGQEASKSENWKKMAFYNIIPAYLFMLISKRGEPLEKDDIIKGLVMYPFLSVPVIGPIMWGSAVAGFVGGDNTLLSGMLRSGGRLAKDLADAPEKGFGSEEIGRTMRSAAQLMGIPLQPLRIAQTMIDAASEEITAMPDSNLSGDFAEKNAAARVFDGAVRAAARSVK